MILVPAREGPCSAKQGQGPSHGCVWNTRGRKAGPTQQRTGLVTVELKVEKVTVVSSPAYPGSIPEPHGERASGLER